MAKMVGPEGKVIGIDHIQELIELSESNIRKHHSELLDSKVIQLKTGDGRLGYEPESPYHAIHVGAAAKTLPKELVDQLVLGGRLILPIGKTANTQKLEQIDKLQNGEVTRKELCAVRFVPLTDKECQWSDET